MNHSQASAETSSTRTRHPRPRTVTTSVALPQTRPENLELRDLLEANLHALRALHEEHQRMIQLGLRSIDEADTTLRGELRAIGSAKAPWVRAMSETRALLFVALRELIVGEHEAELSMALPRQAGALAEPLEVRSARLPARRPIAAPAPARSVGARSVGATSA